jgi:hypothetical protein
MDRQESSREDISRAFGLGLLIPALYQCKSDKSFGSGCHKNLYLLNFKTEIILLEQNMIKNYLLLIIIVLLISTLSSVYSFAEMVDPPLFGQVKKYIKEYRLEPGGGISIHLE